MKKICFLFMVSLLFFGCEDLDRQPLTTLSEETFWQSAEDAEKGVNGIYNVLLHKTMYGYFFMHTDAIAPNLYSMWSYNNILEISENRGYDASSNYPVWLWGKCYEGIVRANQVLVHVPGISMDETLQSRILAEARFLRALFYFHLTNLFGDVPLILELQTAGDEALVSRDPKATVVSAILSDLQFAMDNLPESYSGKDIGRITKGAATALKSRVHLYNQQYALTITAVNAVTALGYDLLPMADWPDQFLPAMENNTTESIFEVQFTGMTGSNTGSSFNFSSGALVFRGEIIPVQNFFDSFEAGDPRRGWTILSPGEDFGGETFDTSRTITGYARRKGIIPDPLVINDGDANAVVIRYAEMLLNLAEAENELNGPAGAYAPVNKIRNRVGLPNLSAGLTQAEMREAIKQERRSELAYEGHYYFDLLRWGGADLQAAMEIVTSVPVHARYYDPKLLLWPVPQREIDVNPNLLPQNPGW